MDLLTITIIFDAVDKDPSISNPENNPYKVWTIAALATMEVVTERASTKNHSNT